MKKDGRLMASLCEIIDQIKIAILTTGLVKQLAFFVVILMPQEGAAWGVGFEIHGWR